MGEAGLLYGKIIEFDASLTNQPIPDMSIIIREIDPMIDDIKQKVAAG
jgi:hypothetical protein